MKRTQLFVFILVLMVAAVAVSQTPTTPAQQGTQAPAQAQPAAPAAPQGKPLPEAKTQEEFEAYKVAATNANDLGVLETAAADFEKKFPDSQLRILLYNQLMMGYQGANQPEKAIEMARKVNTLDPTDPVSAMVIAMNIADRIRETDLDRDEKAAEATKFANLSLQNVDTGMMVQAGTPPEQLQANKNLIRTEAHTALGQVSMAKTDYPGAEQHYREALDSSKANPNPFLYLRLSLAQDRQKKYNDALVSANEALRLSPANSPYANVAKQQVDRLRKLTGQATATPAPAAPATAAPATTTNTTAPKTTTPPPTPKK